MTTNSAAQGGSLEGLERTRRRQLGAQKHNRYLIHKRRPALFAAVHGLSRDRVAGRLRGKRRDGRHAQGFLVAINGRASGAISAQSQLVNEVAGSLVERGQSVDAVVTDSERELGSVLASADGRRVVLVGGDGSVHAAANAPLRKLPELALVPAGRANNIARALGIPTERAAAIAVAAGAAARPLDALLVETAERSMFALEAISAGFQAEARGHYAGDSSSDLRQGVRVLASAVRRYTPYRVEVRLDTHRVLACRGAQLFFSNMPLFGFGFEVDPGADPADGRFEAVLLEADSRRALLNSWRPTVAITSDAAESSGSPLSAPS